MTMALAKFIKDENDLFNIMNDRLQKDKFIFVGSSDILYIFFGEAKRYIE